jgi:hypothetical protein
MARTDNHQNQHQDLLKRKLEYQFDYKIKIYYGNGILTHCQDQSKTNIKTFYMYKLEYQSYYKIKVDIDDQDQQW